jgi:hypothetical protein
MTLTREELLAPREMPREKIDVPELGGSVYVRALSGLERDAFEADVFYSREKGAAGLRNMRARLAVRCLCDERGTLLMTPEDADALGRQHSHAIDVMFQTAQRLNGIGDHALTDIKGNSQPILGDAQS